jgi:hypothetical protein
MKEFKEILLKINEKLNVPQPVKSRILLEISTDMQDLYQHYISKGELSHTAVKMVKDRFDLDEQNLSELVSLHQTPIKKFVDKLNLGEGTSFKLVLIYVLIVSILALGIYSITSTPFFAQSSGYVYPVGAIGILTLFFIFCKFFQLYLIKDHTMKSLWIGMSVIIFGTILTFLTGVIGFFKELSLTLHRVFVPLHDLVFEIAPQHGIDDSVYREIVQWSLRISSLMIVTLGMTLALIMLWLLVIRKTKIIEKLEVQNLLTK